jgi:hypothetical protein
VAQRLFSGWITKTTVVNIGSKERQKEDTPVSFGNTFADKWEEVEEYALCVLNNSEDELHEPVVNHTKTFFVAAEDDLKPPATPQGKMYKNEDKLPVIPNKKPSVTANDDKKPAATLLEEA